MIIQGQTLESHLLNNNLNSPPIYIYVGICKQYPPHCFELTTVNNAGKDESQLDAKITVD